MQPPNHRLCQVRLRHAASVLGIIGSLYPFRGVPGGPPAAAAPPPPRRGGGSLQPENAKISHFHFSRCGQRPFLRCCKGKRFTVLGQFDLGKTNFQPGLVCLGWETHMSCAGASRGTVRVKPNSPHRLGGSPRAHIVQRMENPGSEMARPRSRTGGGGVRGAQGKNMLLHGTHKS